MYFDPFSPHLIKMCHISLFRDYNLYFILCQKKKKKKKKAPHCLESYSCVFGQQQGTNRNVYLY